MRRALSLVTCLTLIATGCSTSNRDREDDDGREVEVTLDQLPPAVRDTLSRESGGAPVGKVMRENENGKTLYEAMITKGGKTWELEVDEAGNVVEREEADDDED